MTHLTVLKQPATKSRFAILECFRRTFKLVRKQEIVMCATICITIDGTVHLDKVGPVNLDDKDRLLEAIEDLHEKVYTSL